MQVVLTFLMPNNLTKKGALDGQSVVQSNTEKQCSNKNTKGSVCYRW